MKKRKNIKKRKDDNTFISNFRDKNLGSAKELYSIDEILILQGDAANKGSFEKPFADLTVTSPPYNVGIQYKSNNDELDYDDYLEFSNQWLKNCYKWTNQSGRLLLNIPLDKNKGGQRSVGADLTIIAKEVGWKYHSTIVWNEGNISRRTAWGSWLSASAPYVIAPVELIIVLYKNEWKKTSVDKKSDIHRDEFMAWTNGLWSFNGESKKRIGHPAPFPLELPKRCIKLFSFVGDTVFDPFAGSGTTLLASHILKRKAVGLEIDLNYCKLSYNRLNKEAKLYLTSLEF